MREAALIRRGGSPGDDPFSLNSMTMYLNFYEEHTYSTLASISAAPTGQQNKEQTGVQTYVF
jgi:hypothetical protein